MGQGNLGIVLNFEYSQAASDSAGDKRAAAVNDGIFNRWFIEAITRQVMAGLAGAAG